MLFDYGGVADASEAKAFNGQHKHYYIFLVGTMAECEGRGLGTSIVKYWQEIAAREGVPVFLEASTEYSMKLYLKLGFEIVDEGVIGKGKANRQGEIMKGGEGVRLWPMVWRPSGDKSNSVTNEGI